jgi:hypothetical protein
MTVRGTMDGPAGTSPVLQFDSSTAASDAAEASPRPALRRPPGWLLSAAAADLVVSAVMVPLRTEASHLVGWVLASFVAIGLLAAYTRSDVRLEMSEPGYVYRPDRARLRTALVAVSFVAAFAHAWLFATLVAS